MNMKVQKIFLSVIILFNCVFIYSQSITTVTSDKVGKLSNQIKKKNILEITHLKINGTMNSDDFAYIGTMTNLEYLDIEDVKLSKEKEKNKKSESESNQQKNGKYKKADNKGHSDNKYQKWKYKEVSRQSSRFVPKTGDSVTVTNVIALFVCCFI